MPPGNKPGFYEIDGGAGRYVRAFGAALSEVDVRLGGGARRIEREGGGAGFLVEDEHGEKHCFDQLIVATSARDAAKLLRDVPGAGEMQAAVGGFRHFETEIVIHGDRALMPADERDWAHTNLFFEGDRAWMSDWQGLHENVPVFRTWLPKGRPQPRPFYGRRAYHHLIMTPENGILQRRIAALQGASGLWVTGMYAADVDNHESALLSALPPVQALAPRSENLARLLGAVAPDAAHGLEVLPTPFASAPGGREAEAARYLSVSPADEPSA
jgi:predicted NAD/FAD-binding protein